MRIPTDTVGKEEFLRLIIDACMASQQERRALYEKRRRYFLYGQNLDQKAKFNRLKSHMKLVSSFLFSADGLIYNITPPKNSDEQTAQKFLALQDDFNEDIHDSGVADIYGEGVEWALNYDTMILKMGWNDTSKQLFASLVEPSSFGVYREDNNDFNSQPAMNHMLLLDYDDACDRLTKAGKKDMISRLQIEGATAESGLPPALTQMIISATGGENLAGNIMGSVNPNYQSTPSFRANLLAPMVRFHETWVWDSEAEDYRIFHSLAGPVLLSDSAETIEAICKASTAKGKFNSETNWFLEKENPFIPITPFPLYNLFWGDCHQEDISPLQDWSNQRLEQIDELLNEQTDPPKSFSGFQGLTDEIAAAYGGEGTYVSDAMPGAKAEIHPPQLPEDLFKEFNEIGALMMEASGLTEVVSGRSSGGARGGQQQKQMQITGGGQIKRVAVGLERSLVKMGDIGLKLKMKNDDTQIKTPTGEDFVAAQVPEGFDMRVDGHSHSPLYTLESRELAQVLFKAQSIDREWFIRMINPTQKNNLIQSLRAREKAEAAARAATPQPPAHTKKK